MQTHAPLKLDDRKFIAYRLRLHCGFREIARHLFREHSVVSREVHANGGGKKYDAEKAQTRSDRMRKRRGRKKKLECDMALHDYVVAEIRQGRSPDSIAGRMKIETVSALRGSTLSHESIYRYIYEGEGRWEALFHCLRYKHRRRRKRYSRKPQGKVRIPERI